MKNGEQYSYMVLHMDEHYAFDVRKVVEISEQVDIISAPNAAPYIAGAGRIRERLVPLVDLRKRLGKQPGLGGDPQLIIVVSYQGRELGLITDTTIDIVQLDPSAIEPLPPATKNKPGGFVQGLYINGDEIYLMLDIDKLIAMSELSGLVEAAARSLDSN